MNRTNSIWEFTRCILQERHAIDSKCAFVSDNAVRGAGREQRSDGDAVATAVDGDVLVASDAHSLRAIEVGAKADSCCCGRGLFDSRQEIETVRDLRHGRSSGESKPKEGEADRLAR